MATKARTGIFPSNVDPVTGALYTIPHRHAKIHGERSFYHKTVENFGSNDSNRTEMNYLLITPSVASLWKCHFNFKIRASGGLSIEVYEGTTVSAAGTGLNEINHDRNSSIVANLQVEIDCTVNDIGLLLWQGKIGDTISDTIDNSEVTLVNSDEEMILKAATNYLIYIAPRNTVIADVVCDTYLTWYEHQDIE